MNFLISCPKQLISLSAFAFLLSACGGGPAPSSSNKVSNKAPLSPSTDENINPVAGALLKVIINGAEVTNGSDQNLGNTLLNGSLTLTVVLRNEGDADLELES